MSSVGHTYQLVSLRHKHFCSPTAIQNDFHFRRNLRTQTACKTRLLDRETIAQSILGTDRPRQEANKCLLRNITRTTEFQVLQEYIITTNVIQLMQLDLTLNMLRQRRIIQDVLSTFTSLQDQ